MENKNCKHQKTYKLFYMNCKPRQWVRTDLSLCMECGEVIIKKVKEVIKDGAKSRKN